ncbi:M50 family metallopeptidase [Pseudomonas fluorescens]|jgi:hypothetical protein|uniref:M50 family metallopeptidase n=1 Tax=Pseudomonas TaxID=286 RepID=UPI001A91BF9E|nr:MULTISPECIES: M50 family metallopeptidase [Pseudomonas]MDZ5433339.1 M50 family metallopeptidase [Pseudomonas fluorescens]
MMGNKWVMSLLKLLSLSQTIVSVSGVLATAFILGIGIDSDFAPLWATVLTVVLIILSTCIHEGGHYLGAKWSHMTVLAVRVAAVELLPLRRGWRMRWSPQPKRSKLGGYIMAAADPRLPMSRQFIVMIVMGPLANLVVGCLCIGVGFSSQETMRMFMLALGVSNIAMGVSNLIPTYLGGSSDGAGLIAWCLVKEEQIPMLANARLLALSVAGTPSEELPDDDIALLTSEPMPAPLLAIWYRLNALQSQGDWHAATQQGHDLQTLLEASSHNLGSLALLISILQIELGFSKAMLLRCTGELRDDLLSDEVDWCCPSLRPRCLAFREFVAGNAVAAEKHLERSLSQARNSPNLSLSKSETRLASHIRELGKGELDR